MRAYMVLLLVFLVPGRSLGEQSTAGSRVQKVQRLYQQLFFDDAAKVCQAVLDDGKNNRSDMRQLLLYNGVLAAVQQKQGAAVAAFKQLLVVNPVFRLDNTHPPRVRRAFVLAQRWLKRQKPLMIDVATPQEVLRRGKTEVAVNVLSDPLSMVKHGVLYIRAARQGPYRVHLVKLGRQARWSVDLDGIEGIARATSLEYIVAVLDGNYNQLTLHGSTHAPNTIKLAGAPALRQPVVATAPSLDRRRRGPAASPWYAKWWLWAAVGTVVTASIVAVSVTASSPSGTVDAPVTLEAGGSP